MDSLTQHFYPIDGAAAHLLCALMTGYEEDAHAAASELAANSQTEPLLFKILCFAWWLQSPEHPLQYARHEAFLANDSHGLFTSLLSSPFDLPQLPMPAATNMLPLQKAIKKRDVACIYTNATKMDSNALESLGIQPQYLQAMQSTVYKPLETRILYHACAALVSYKCTPPPAKPWVNYPRGITGRVFAINAAACAAWGVKPSPPEALRGDPTKLIPTQLFETEEHEIEFYNTHFPDDIPDEWSDAEISKSHSGAHPEFHKNPWRAAFFDCF
jgi:hypothetical protein